MWVLKIHPKVMGIHFVHVATAFKVSTEELVGGAESE